MSSASPERPRSLKRLSQKRTVAPHRFILAAISGALRPAAACCTICARRTSPAPSVRERAMHPSSAASSSPKARTRIVIGRLPHRPAAGLNAPDQKKSQITSRMHHLVALLRLVHLRVTRLLLVFGRGRGGDDRGIDNRPLAHQEPAL